MSTLALPPGPTQLEAPPPPSDLAPDSFAARLYGMLAPLGQYDLANAWALLILCNAIGTSYQLVEDWVRDTPDGPGWSLLLDLDRCPPEALPWLGQFVGVRLLPDSTDEESRHRIGSTDGFKRGTLDALKSAAWRTLTGNRSVFVYERDGTTGDPDNAYHLTVVTYTSQTPDPAATQQALLAQKPGGLVLVYSVIDGQTYTQVGARFATYADVRAAYPSYSVMAADQPGP